MFEHLDAVVYVDSGSNPLYRELIISHYQELNSLSIEYNQKPFIPISYLQELEGTILTVYKQSLVYHYPHLSSSELDDHVALFQQTYNALAAYISKHMDSSSTDLVQLFNANTRNPYAAFPLDYPDLLLSWLSEVLNPEEQIDYDIGYQRVVSHFDALVDPDENENYQELAWEVEEKVKQLLEIKAFTKLQEVLLQLAEGCGISPTDMQALIQKSEKLNMGLSSKLSRLQIDEKLNFVLLDYNEVEIKMPTLSKVVYLLFLNHPEGILFKEIADYQEELTALYRRFANRAGDNFHKSLEDLLNPFHNSLHEKCSRIKEAFVSVMGDELARHYYIRGERGKKKLISLDRKLCIDQTRK